MNTATLLLLTRPAVTSAPTNDSGFVEASAAAPQVNVMDLGITRGDGFFETISVVDGHPQALEPHLARLKHSAELMDMPEPDTDVWRLAVLAGIGAHQLEHGVERELFAKLIMTRGVEGTGTPTGWVYVDTGEDFTAARQGIRVVSLDRGYRHDVAETSPWLLQGAKTLSYAVNRAALREAARRGAQDVIFVSADGFALEGPTSNVIVRNGDRVRTPQTDQGILAGTTQASVFEFFESRGIRTSYEHIPAGELADADALWLVSSVRQAAPVTNLDGRDFQVDADLSAELNTYLLSRTH
ncbi:aminodeoxychorismate lyase [Diaminobutyricibacter sp. McL0608]|uniref:aminodeoxychorismate lyase n=1 Tax=Leifsonia sp. McL0608 TaxID=3143537 RepID=UPI0031F2E7A6